MTKKLPLALALAAGFAVVAPMSASACGQCGNRHHVSSVSYARPMPVARPAYHPAANYCAPVRRAPVCAPVVCQPVCDPCRRSGLLGLGILGIL